jgi:hypothetical protein
MVDGIGPKSAERIKRSFSFKSFLKMSSAQHVAIRLGSKRFNLKPNDINALGGMASRVVPPNGVEGG